MTLSSEEGREGGAAEMEEMSSLVAGGLMRKEVREGGAGETASLGGGGLLRKEVKVGIAVNKVGWEGER